MPFPEERSKLACTNFRHASWASRRQRTETALKVAGAGEARLERFRRCGDIAWVLQSTTDRGRYRLATNRCRDRFCVPCANEHRQTVCRNLREALKGRTLRFLTLTLRSTENPLDETLSRLYASWSRLRAIMKRTQGLTGGIAFLEVTLNSATHLWHPHLHILFEGAYVPKSWLSSTWLEITGDSFIVDIRALRDSNQAAGYVSKYAGKGIAANVVLDDDRFPEAVEALQAHRCFQTFGTWTGLHLSRHPESDVGWEPLRPLYLVIQDAANGCAVSRLILQSLIRSDSDDPITLCADLPP